MRIAIGTVTLALALALSFVQPACAQSQDQWDRLAELTVSENIELIDMSQRATQGRFAGYSREALLIDVAGRPTSISRKDVCMVNRLESSRRWRKIWLYSLAGAGTGAVIGALGWASTNERIGRDFLKNYSLVGVATGASMGAASRSEPLRFNVYRGTCAVEYRPDSFLPMMEIYGGFSLAAIETGATPAGGFEVGRPASARRVVSGGVFSMTFPVNEHLRLVAGEISVHSGDSGLTGLSKPARRVDGYYLMAGPEFTRRGNQWTLFGHLLAGFPITNLSTPGAAPTPIVLQGAPIPDRTTIFATDSGTALMIGGGADINISRWLAFRAGQLDFIGARVRRDTAVIGEYTSPWWEHNWKLSTGMVIRVINDNTHLVVRDPRIPVQRNTIRTDSSDKPERSRWTTRVAFGGAINAVNEPDILIRRDGQVGNALIGFKDAVTWEVSADFNFAQNLALRAGYQLSNLDFGTDSTQLGTAQYHMPKFGLLFTHRERSLNVAAGVLAGPNYYTGIRKSDAAANTFGIQEITSGAGFQVGPGLDLQWKVKRTGVLLGVGGFLPIFAVKTAVMNIETSPNSAFEKGTARFGPTVYSLTVGYQFP